MADLLLVLAVPIAVVGWRWGLSAACALGAAGIAALAALDLLSAADVDGFDYIAGVCVFAVVAVTAAGWGRSLARVAQGRSGGRPTDLKPTLEEVLTGRELEVLEMLADGATNSQIAERLVISLSTAKSHVKSILQKLGASNRTEAVSQYLRR